MRWQLSRLFVQRIVFGLFFLSEVCRRLFGIFEIFGIFGVFEILKILAYPELRHKRSAARASNPPWMSTPISKSWSRWRRSMKCSRVAMRKQALGSKDLLQTAWRIVAMKLGVAPSPRRGAGRRKLAWGACTPRNPGWAERRK